LLAGAVTGGGGAGGADTDTVAFAVVSPPGPIAVNVYVVVSDGITRRFPLAITVPMPLLIEVLVAPVTVHRSTADWPRSMLVGSTENSPTTGLVAGGAGADSATGAGGGGGAMGAFFLHADAKMSRVRTINSSPEASNTRRERRNRNGE